MEDTTTKNVQSQNMYVLLYLCCAVIILTLPHDDVTVFFSIFFPWSISSAKPHVLSVDKIINPFHG